jgi:hypothetical protein
MAALVLFATWLNGLGATARAESSPVAATVSLAGSWGFRLDPEDQGVTVKWFESQLPDKIRLPGSTDENGYGTKNTEREPHWLNRLYKYAGPAWYQREVTIPDDWQGKRIVLFLERCHWETRVWVDGTAAGMQDSLCTPHEYDLSSLLAPGKHRLTIRVDNRMKHNVGKDAHSVADHTQTNWNGIVGRIELMATDPIWIKDVQVYPNLSAKSIHIRVAVGNASGQAARGVLTFTASPSDPKSSAPAAAVASTRTRGEIGPGKQTTVTIDLAMGPDVKLWDEFSPATYQLTAALSVDGQEKAIHDEKTVRFGMREFSTKGTQFSINGRPTFLRGTLECCIFPLTGYPATDVPYWTHMLQVAKAHGLNHLRFHSWCPPEAAFEAADRVGVYIHVETPVWTVLGSDPDVDAFIEAEGQRILQAYGNHPSFSMLCVGNEPSGPNQGKFLAKIVTEWKEKDSRRVYSGCSGWPELPTNQYQVMMSRKGPVRGHVWGAGLKSRMNALPPATTADYREAIAGSPAPIVGHEIGQWCVYPNFKEIAKYTGVLRARNFEIVRDSLQQHHMLDQAGAFLMASGKLQAALYKEEVEAALRTPGFGGFQLLDLHDFPGQGTALVGVLDPFWDSKGYVTPEEFHQFCCETVPLARLEKRTWTTAETLVADVEIAHFGPAPIEKAQPTWSLCFADGRPAAEGTLPETQIPLGNCIKLGRIETPLAAISAPTKLVLTIGLKGTPYANTWDLWVYPADLKPTVPAQVLVAENLDDGALAALKAGQKVLLMPPLAAIRSDIPPGFTTIFWNTAWTRRQPPHTLGILCDPQHPTLAQFPTEYHSNWQWWDLVTRSRFMILDQFPEKSRPIVQVIDDWNTNRKLGLVFEAKVGGGKLLMTSIDLKTDLDRRPAARQMLASLLAYLASDQFAPSQELSVESIRSLLRKPPLMGQAKVIRVDSEAQGYEGQNAIDGNPDTIWHTAWEPVAPPYPHEIQIDLGRPIRIQGLKYLPRQDMKNGWIVGYEIYVSPDGKQWGQPAAKGEFAPGSEEKTVTLDRPSEGRYLRLVATSGLAQQRFAAIAELDIIPDGK